MTPSEPVIGPRLLRTIAPEPEPIAWSAPTLLRWNESVGDFLAEVPPEKRRSTLRQIELEVGRWWSRQKPEQAAWVAGKSRPIYRGPVGASTAILGRLG